LTDSDTVRVSSGSRGASSSEGMRSTSNPVRRLRRGDFQGNPGESGKCGALVLREVDRNRRRGRLCGHGAPQARASCEAG
jgi:hypothetical protein